MSFNIIKSVSIVNMEITSYQYSSDPFCSSKKSVLNNSLIEDKEECAISKELVFKDGMPTVWKEVSFNCEPRFHVIPLFPFKNKNLKISKSMQKNGETVKLNLNRFFKLDLSGMQKEFRAQFNNKKIILIYQSGEIALDNQHSKEGISFRTPKQFDVGQECVLKIVGDKSDLYSTNVEIANLKV